MSHKSQHRCLILKVTEWRGEYVWKTKIIGLVWVDDGVSIEEENAIAQAHGGDMLGSMPTSTPYDEWF